MNVKFTLFFECSEETMEARLLERGKTSGRSDDNMEAIRKRFKTFHRESMPVVEKMESEGLLRRVSAERDMEDVWRDVQMVFGPAVVFVLGRPGAGKGTQCARLSETFGYKHLSAGDLLREERKNPGSTYGELIEGHIKEGKLVPVEITVKLIEQAMHKHGWEGGKYLIDGFPRSVDNLEGWDQVLGGKVNVKFTLFFECSEEAVLARLLERGKTSGRSDDNVEAIKKRFATFQTETQPVVDRMDAAGKLQRVSAERSVDQVWKETQALFAPSVVFVLGGPGSGKGTQCERISKTFGYKHLSAGDLLREERQRPGSMYGELIEGYIKEGKLVPVEITVKLIEQAMNKHGWEGGKYLVDGFPRSFNNLSGWVSLLDGKVNVKFTLFFECSEQCMEARLLERGKTSGRSDDNMEAIKKRFVTFQMESMPVVERLEVEGKLRRINAERDLEEVWRDVKALFGPSVVFMLGGPGAGKGTMCRRISETFRYKYLSTGQLLMQERDEPVLGFSEVIARHIKDDSGSLVPADVTVKVY